VKSDSDERIVSGERPRGVLNPEDECSESSWFKSCSGRFFGSQLNEQQHDEWIVIRDRLSEGFEPRPRRFLLDSTV